MYSDIKNIEETNAALLLTSMSDHKYINKVSETTVNSHGHHNNEYPFPLKVLVSTHNLALFIVGVEPNFITVPHLSGSWLDLMEVGWENCLYLERIFVIMMSM